MLSTLIRRLWGKPRPADEGDEPEVEWEADDGEDDAEESTEGWADRVWLAARSRDNITLAHMINFVDKMCPTAGTRYDIDMGQEPELLDERIRGELVLARDAALIEVFRAIARHAAKFSPEGQR